MVVGYPTWSPHICLFHANIAHLAWFPNGFPAVEVHDLSAALIFLYIIVHIWQDEVCDSSLNIEETIIGRRIRMTYVALERRITTYGKTDFS